MKTIRQIVVVVLTLTVVVPTVVTKNRLDCKTILPDMFFFRETLESLVYLYIGEERDYIFVLLIVGSIK